MKQIACTMLVAVVALIGLFYFVDNMKPSSIVNETTVLYRYDISFEYNFINSQSMTHLDSNIVISTKYYDFAYLMTVGGVVDLLTNARSIDTVNTPSHYIGLYNNELMIYFPIGTSVAVSYSVERFVDEYISTISVSRRVV